MTGKPTLSASMLVLGFGLSLLFASAAQGQAPTGTKVGVASIQDIIVSTNEGKQAFADLEQKFSPRKVELENLNNEIVRLTADLQKTGDKLSDEERANRARTIDTKKKTLQRNVDDAQAEY